MVASDDHLPTKSAQEILLFWFNETKPAQWWRRDDKFDATIVERFGKIHAQAAIGTLDDWQNHPQNCLALIVVLDQFSRNIFRDTPSAFACDDKAQILAKHALLQKFDLEANEQRRAFFYLPFMHAECIDAQKQCVALHKERLPTTSDGQHALEHFNIIKEFGRFPHRNKILNRQSTKAEIEFLQNGGFNP